jgi:hypothetical protein
MGTPKIILSFDYELFLGEKSGSLEKCIIEPTERLIHVFKETNIKATFFVDVCYLTRLLEKNEKMKREALKVKEQLQKLLIHGHRIELHLHPHWLNAKLINDRWVFTSYKNYRLHNLAETEITELFVHGVKMLNDIGREVIDGYQVRAFRAGGYCLQPFSKLKKAFNESNIKIDSSVVPNLKASSRDHFFDYLDFGILDEIYRFEDNVKGKIETGQFMEVPITTFKKSLTLKIIDKLFNYFNKITGDGKGMIMEKEMNQNIIDRIYKMLSSYHTTLSLDYSSFYTIKHAIKSSKRDLYVFVSHPKTLNSKAEKYIIKLKEMGFDFVTYNDLIT